MQSRFALALCTLAILASTACSAGNDASDPPAFPTDGDVVDEPTQLHELDVADDEPIADESDPDAEDFASLDENPLAADEEEAPGLNSLSNAPAGEKSASVVTGRSVKCPGTYEGKCVCTGSPYNCQFPNDVQPGRDRYLPPSFITEFDKRHVPFDDVLEAGAWEMTPGFQLYDGQGHARGNYKRPCSTFANATGAALDKDTSKVCVRVNFGQMKDMVVDGAKKRFVYVLSGAADGKPVSGWVPFANALDKTNLAKMGAHAPRAVKAIVPTKYVLKSAIDWKQDPKTFVADHLPGWVLAGVGIPSKHVKPQAGDYLLRNGNVINLIYSTPGVGGASTDTFLVEHEKLAFERVHSTHARVTLVRIPVDDAKKKSMVFAYGSIAGRFGWLALDAIKKGVVAAAAPAPAPPSSQQDLCAGKPDGVVCAEPDVCIQCVECKGGVTLPHTCP